MASTKTPAPARPRMLRREEAAERLGVSMATLSRWAAERSDGPPFLKLGHGRSAVRYPEDRLEQWIEDRLKNPK